MVVVGACVVEVVEVVVVVGACVVEVVVVVVVLLWSNTVPVEISAAVNAKVPALVEISAESVATGDRWFSDEDVLGAGITPRTETVK